MVPLGPWWFPSLHRAPSRAWLGPGQLGRGIGRADLALPPPLQFSLMTRMGAAAQVPKTSPSTGRGAPVPLPVSTSPRAALSRDAWLRAPTAGTWRGRVPGAARAPMPRGCVSPIASSSAPKSCQSPGAPKLRPFGAALPSHAAPPLGCLLAPNPFPRAPAAAPGARPPVPASAGRRPA